MTDEQLVAIEARAAAATKGPWRNEDDSVETPIQCPDEDAEGATYRLVSNNAYDGGIYLSAMLPGDAEFVAHARDDVPALCAEVRRLREENRDMANEMASME